MDAHDRRPAAPAILRRRDQVSVAALVSVALAGMVTSWLYQGGHRGQWINIDRAKPREIHFQLDVNEADWPEWSLLPNIGETLARRIVDFRDRRGPFRQHDELLQVKGIGPRTLESIRPYLLPVGPPPVARDGGP